RQGEEVERHQSAEDKNGGVGNLLIRPDERQDEGDHSHHHQWIEKRPEDAERHIPVANLEILLGEIRNDEDGIAVPHRSWIGSQKLKPEYNMRGREGRSPGGLR